MNSISSKTGIPKMKLTKSVVAGLAAACILFCGNASRAQSSIANVFPNGNYQFQYSPTLSFTASSAAGVTSVNVQLTITSLLTGQSYLENLALGSGLTTTG